MLRAASSRVSSNAFFVQSDQISHTRSQCFCAESAKQGLWQQRANLVAWP